MTGGRGDIVHVSIVSIVVMGVSGSGKSTVAKEIATRRGYVFLEADELHGAKQIHKMATGHPLTDEDRLPWLRRVGERISEEIDAGHSSITACSALTRAYRDVLRECAPALFFVWLDGPIDTIRAHISSRHHHFMPPSLLESQFATLEPLGPGELGVRIDINQEPAAIIRDVERAIESLT